MYYRGAEEPKMSGPAVFVTHYRSPIGLVEIEGSERGISTLNFVEAKKAKAERPGWGPLPTPLAEALAQLEEYFQGRRRTFSVKLDLGGTPFQRRVWRELRAVGFGRTTTYKAIAEAVGRPAATRAVGGANHRNPVSIIVPCHRVVGSDGGLTGYGGGLWRKEWLLRHESRDLTLS
jgi:methylated-DNA-[protein]-cysteine S-methyltransferase